MPPRKLTVWVGRFPLVPSDARLKSNAMITHTKSRRPSSVRRRGFGPLMYRGSRHTRVRWPVVVCRSAISAIVPVALASGVEVAGISEEQFE